jgi:hypothetical protein
MKTKKQSDVLLFLPTQRYTQQYTFIRFRHSPDDTGLTFSYTPQLLYERYSSLGKYTLHDYFRGIKMSDRKKFLGKNMGI